MVERRKKAMNELLSIVLEKDGQPVTTSKAVAEQFEKRHNHVMGVTGAKAI